MEIYEVRIEAITPSAMPKPEGHPKDESWFLRRTVRTFKVAAEDQDALDKVANDLLEAYLLVEGGIGTWTTTRWYNR